MAYIKCLRNVISSGVPDGKTVTPTDVVATWLACGSRTEGYTTLSAVLADSTCLNALMASDNAVDYLVRSTTFASDITSDSGAMTAIGLNNYCANTLLGNSTWCNAIAQSAYIESVCNVKNPVMTNNTTPSGTASASAKYKSEPYLIFDHHSNTAWYAKIGSSNQSAADYEYIQYEFATAQPISIIKYKEGIDDSIYAKEYPHTTTISFSADGTTFNTVDTREETGSDVISIWHYKTFTTPQTVKAVKAELDKRNIKDTTNSLYYTTFAELQLYGRTDI